MGVSKDAPMCKKDGCEKRTNNGYCYKHKKLNKPPEKKPEKKKDRSDARSRSWVTEEELFSKKKLREPVSKKDGLVMKKSGELVECEDIVIKRGKEEFAFEEGTLDSDESPDDIVDSLFDEILKPAEAEQEEEPTPEPTEEDKKLEKIKLKNAMMTSHIIKVAYFATISISENFSESLQGLSQELKNDALVNECLEELGEIYTDELGLSQMSPEYRLMLLTGVAIAGKFMSTSIKEKSTKSISVSQSVLDELDKE